MVSLSVFALKTKTLETLELFKELCRIFCGKFIREGSCCPVSR